MNKADFKLKYTRGRSLRYFFLLLLCMQSFALDLAAQKKPNIVLFIADDLNQEDLGCYGNNEVRTPNIDRLAAEGMRFTKAYAASPMCSPSRGTLFTGLYPHRNGIQMNHFTTKVNTRSLPHYLQQQGYRVVISGKIHVGPEECFPFEHIGKEFGQYEPIENRLDKKKETVGLIRQHFKERPDQPLCLIVAPWVPHVPWFPNRDFDPDRLTLPAYLADTKETRHALASYYQSIGEADQFFGEVMQTLKEVGKESQTVSMFISDQGAQFPSAKWTVYDKGIRVPLIIKWPGNVKNGAVSDALVSLVDMLPTMVDISGAEEVKGLDGRSFKAVLSGKSKTHHDYVFAETSVEPHYWYNYTPARSVITKEGFHYIKNYYPGLRFVTHIDKVERNEFYFDSWVEKSKTDEKAAFLLDRYSYHPPEELFNLNGDADEFVNLVKDGSQKQKLQQMRQLLNAELQRQGETEEMILLGPLPKWGDRNYSIRQNSSVSNLSFKRSEWNPDTLYITAYLDGVHNGGVVCDYFNNFKLFAYQGRIGIITASGALFQTQELKENTGQLILKLSSSGKLDIVFNGQPVLNTQVDGDLTKIKGGYVTCGQLQGIEAEGRLQSFKGQIRDLQFSMNQLLRNP